MKENEIDRHIKARLQLGMPRGTASNRLRKLVLFDVLKRHNENICYQCKKPIDFADQLSIEHKNPWENIDVNLFWDLSNIAFSHLSCNCRAAKKVGYTGPRKIPNNGNAWCRIHKEWLPIQNFSKNGCCTYGIRWECKECEKKYKDSHRYGKV
jgi:hypothetical protein